MNRCAILAVGCMLSMVGPAVAQVDKPAAPEVPFRNSLEDNSQWVVDITYANKPAAPGPETKPQPRVTQVRHAKFGGNQRIVRVWDTAESTETWIWKGYVLLREPYFAKGAMFLENAATSSIAISLQANAFPELAWATPNTFVHEKQFSFGLLNLYQIDARPAPAPGAPEIPARQLYTDPKTGLPVVFKEGDVLRKYKFLDPLRGPLTLTPEYATMLEKLLRQADEERFRRY